MDYRSMSASTRVECYPKPYVNKLLNYLSGYSVFSSLDLQMGYHQIKIKLAH